MSNIKKYYIPYGSANKLYHTWYGMKQRCLNPKSVSYKRYGQRGIKMSNKWINSFNDFYNYVSTLPKYEYDKIGLGKDKLTLDRIDNDGDYEYGNLRWATTIEQYHNSTSTYSKLMLKK